jgi:ABC-type branched-subunit amino acid transport system substrate-binding protein
MRRSAYTLLFTLAVLAVSAVTALAQSKEPVKIGLTAAVSGGSAASGEAIKRGLEIAIA